MTPFIVLVFMFICALFGYAVHSHASSRKTRHDFAIRQRVLIAEGDLAVWAAHLELEPEPEVLARIGRSEGNSGAPVHLNVSMFDDLDGQSGQLESFMSRLGERAPAVGGWIGRSTREPDVSVHLDVSSFDQLSADGDHLIDFVVQLGARVPDGVIIEGSEVPSPMVPQPNHLRHIRYLGSGTLSHQRFDLSGSTRPDAALAFSSSPLFRTLRNICRSLGSRTRSVTLSEGVLVLTVFDPPFIVGDGGKTSVRTCLDLLHDLLLVMPEPYDVADGLARVLRETDESHTRRWEAARLLATQYAGSESLAKLTRSDTELDEFGKAAYARWGDTNTGTWTHERRFKALQAYSRHNDLGDDIRAHLIAVHPWHTMIDERIETFVRVDASKRAFGSSDAPGTRKQQELDLLGMFTSSEASARLTLGVVFEDLTRQGWEPSPGAAAKLAKTRDYPTREALLKHIETRGARTADAPALAALKDMGHARAGDLFGTLDLTRTGGGLSLAEDDATRGGLSQAADRGAISSADD